LGTGAENQQVSGSDWAPAVSLVYDRRRRKGGGGKKRFKKGGNRSQFFGQIFLPWVEKDSRPSRR